MANIKYPQLLMTNKCNEEIYLDVYESNNYGQYKILEMNVTQDVKVQFVSTGFINSFRLGDIRRGEVKDKLFPKHFGVGFIGDGIYTENTSRIAIGLAH